MVTVIFCKGLPSSGKSTWARQWASEASDRIRICPNELNLLLGNERFTRERDSIVVAAVFNLLRNAVAKEVNVVIDDYNLDLARYQRMLTYCRQQHANIVWKIFDTPPDECKQRDRLRSDPAGEENIEWMAEKYWESIKRDATASLSNDSDQTDQSP